MCDCIPMVRPGVHFTLDLWRNGTLVKSVHGHQDLVELVLAMPSATEADAMQKTLYSMRDGQVAGCATNNNTHPGQHGVVEQQAPVKQHREIMCHACGTSVCMKVKAIKAKPKVHLTVKLEGRWCVTCQHLVLVVHDHFNGLRNGCDIVQRYRVLKVRNSTLYRPGEYIVAPKVDDIIGDGVDVTVVSK